MFHELVTTMDVRLMDTRRRVTEAARAAAVRTDRPPTPIADLWRTLGARLLGILADSRESLQSKDLEMAAYGVRRSDPVADRALARELRAGSQRRRAQAAGAAPRPTPRLTDCSGRRRPALTAFGRRPCLGTAE